MNYGLAKKLKDAGWLQTGNDCNWWSGEINGEEVEIYNPTLSELIEACGKKFGGIICLHSINEKYKAFENMWMNLDKPSNSFHSFIKGKVAHGSTPEEAVANLSLELNKK